MISRAMILSTSQRPRLWIRVMLFCALEISATKRFEWRRVAGKKKICAWKFLLGDFGECER